MLHAVFLQLDALHILDISAHFDAGGVDVIRSRRLQTSTLKWTSVLLLTAWSTPSAD